MNPLEPLNKLADSIGQGTEILQNIYVDLAQPGVRKVGQALETVLGVFPTALLPLKGWQDKRNLVFENNMMLVKQKMEKIEDRKIIPVPPELGVPILEKLMYVSNEEISDLFTSLLSSASSVDTAHLGHPGFIKVIENLSVDEAKLINYLIERQKQDLDFDGKRSIPFISYNGFNKIGHFSILTDHLTGIEYKLNITFKDNVHLYLENLVSLGVLICKEDVFLENTPIYGELVEQYNEISNQAIDDYKSKEDYVKYEMIKGVYMVTKFGYSFLESVSK